VRKKYWVQTAESNHRPKDFKSITKWEDRDEAWVDVVKGLKRIIK